MFQWFLQKSYSYITVLKYLIIPHHIFCIKTFQLNPFGTWGLAENFRSLVVFLEICLLKSVSPLVRDKIRHSSTTRNFTRAEKNMPEPAKLAHPFWQLLVDAAIGPKVPKIFYFIKSTTKIWKSDDKAKVVCPEASNFVIRCIQTAQMSRLVSAGLKSWCKQIPDYVEEFSVFFCGLSKNMLLTFEWQGLLPRKNVSNFCLSAGNHFMTRD